MSQSDENVFQGFRNTKSVHDLNYRQKVADLGRKTYKEVSDEWEAAEKMGKSEEHSWFIKYVAFDTAKQKPLAILFPDESILDIKNLCGGKRGNRAVLCVDKTYNIGLVFSKHTIS